MKTSNEIIVGRFYRHVDQPGDIWLGAGKRKMWLGDFTNTCEMKQKFLVLIHTDDPKYLGLVAKFGNDALPDYTEGFILI